MASLGGGGSLMKSIRQILTVKEAILLSVGGVMGLTAAKMVNPPEPLDSQMSAADWYKRAAAAAAEARAAADEAKAAAVEARAAADEAKALAAEIKAALANESSY